MHHHLSYSQVMQLHSCNLDSTGIKWHLLPLGIEKDRRFMTYMYVHVQPPPLAVIMKMAIIISLDHTLYLHPHAE